MTYPMASRFAMVVSAFALFGCAAVPPAHILQREKLVVGTINTLNRNAKHVNVGTVFWENFDLEKPDTDWDLTNLLNQSVTDALLPNHGAIVKSLAAPSWLIEKRDEVLEVGWSTFPLSDEVVPKFAELAKEQGIDVFVVMLPYLDQVEIGLKPTFSGHGLYTYCVGRNGVVCQAYPFANVIVAVIETQPTPRLANTPRVLNWVPGGGVPDVIKELPFPMGAKNVGPDEMKVVKPFVSERMKLLIRLMLAQAGMTEAPRPAGTGTN